MTRRRPPRKVTYFEPVPPRLARSTCTMRVAIAASSILPR